MLALPFSGYTASGDTVKFILAIIKQAIILITFILDYLNIQCNIIDVLGILHTNISLGKSYHV